MTFLQSILLGLVQGVTEFLPVSSSGHLAILEILFGIDEGGLLYEVLLHVATLCALVVVYYRDIWKLIVELCSIVRDLFYDIGIFFMRFFDKDRNYRKLVTSSYRKFVVMIIVSTIPTAIIGYVLRDIVEAASAILLVPGCCLLITALILLISDMVPGGKKKPKEASYGNAFTIGIFQGAATLPGISRSGMTITACVLCGFDRNFAVKYSFILSMPAIIGAMFMEIGDIGSMALDASTVISYVVGMAVAAVVGYVCIKLMMAIVRRKKFKYFSIYCAAIGVISIIAYMRIAR